jgi:uncharacterized protein YggE
MTNVLIATTVAAIGEAETPYNLATFSLSIFREGETQVEAKEKLSLAVEEFQKVLDSLEADLAIKIVKGSLVATPQIQPNYVWDANVRVIKGYHAYYNVRFDIANMNLVSTIYDSLSVIEGISLNSPHFSLKNPDKLNNKALSSAWKKVTERFASECKVLGLNPEDFIVASWETSYSDSVRTSNRRNAIRAASAGSIELAGDVLESAASEPTIGATMASSAPAKPKAPVLEIVVGKARVVVNLNVSYIRK